MLHLYYRVYWVLLGCYCIPLEYYWGTTEVLLGYYWDTTGVLLNYYWGTTGYYRVYCGTTEMLLHTT